MLTCITISLLPKTAISGVIFSQPLKRSLQTAQQPCLGIAFPQLAHSSIISKRNEFYIPAQNKSQSSHFVIQLSALSHLLPQTQIHISLHTGIAQPSFESKSHGVNSVDETVVSIG